MTRRGNSHNNACARVGITHPVPTGVDGAFCQQKGSEAIRGPGTACWRRRVAGDLGLRGSGPSAVTSLRTSTWTPARDITRDIRLAESCGFIGVYARKHLTPYQCEGRSARAGARAGRVDVGLPPGDREHAGPQGRGGCESGRPDECDVGSATAKLLQRGGVR